MMVGPRWASSASASSCTTYVGVRGLSSGGWLCIRVRSEQLAAARAPQKEGQLSVGDRCPFLDARSQRVVASYCSLALPSTCAHKRRARAISSAVRLVLQWDDARPVRSTVVMISAETHGVTARTAPPCWRRRFSALIIRETPPQRRRDPARVSRWNDGVYPDSMMRTAGTVKRARWFTVFHHVHSYNCQHQLDSPPFTLCPGSFKLAPSLCPSS